MITIAAALVAVLLAPATADGPGHILPAGTSDAVYTSGHVGSPVGFGRYRPSNPGEDWVLDGYANPWAAGAFTWAPGGRQTNDYLRVTSSGAVLVQGAPNGTVFVPVARAAGLEVLGILVDGKPSSAAVLTARGGRLLLTPEGPQEPMPGQWWAVGP